MVLGLYARLSCAGAQVAALILSALMLLAPAPSNPAWSQSDLFRGTPPHALMARHALVIGNQKYAEPMFRPLQNPVNDAIAVAGALKQLGFDTKLLTNATRRAMKEHLYDFALRLRSTPGSVGVIYYAGHGLQHLGMNYIVPVDAFVLYSNDIEEELISFKMLTNTLNQALAGAWNEAKAAHVIMVIDACRDIPFQGKLKRFGNGEDEQILLGPAEVDLPQGAAVLFSAAKNQKAFDGHPNPAISWSNSVFTKYFVDLLKKPNLAFSQLVDEIGVAVSFDSQGMQQPTLYRLPGAAPMLFPTAQTFQAEKESWDLIKKDDLRFVDRSAVHKFLQFFPGGYFWQEANVLWAKINQFNPTHAATTSAATAAQVTGPAELKATPSPASDTVALASPGEFLRVLPSERSGWSRVATRQEAEPRGEPVFIDNDRITPVEPQIAVVTVDFEPGQADITLESRATLDSFLASIRPERISLVELAPRDGNDEPSRRNEGLGFKRELVVKDRLAKLGITGMQIADKSDVTGFSSAVLRFEVLPDRIP